MRDHLKAIGFAAVFMLVSAAIVFGALEIAYGGKLSNDVKACRLLDVAMQEADMSPGWYIEAGKVLENHCGIKEARAEAERKACFARRRNDATINCE